MTDQGLVHSQRNTFGKLFEKLMHNKDITDGTCRLFGHMHWRYGSNKDNHEGRKSMGDMLGVTEATINNRIEELEAHDWVITILRGRNEKNGNWQSAFYHVFEDQRECRKFREEYTPADGEYMRPKPTEVRKRKSRKGIGGNPQFTNPTQVEPDNRLNSSLDGGSNSSSTRASNSSLDNLDTVDLDTVDLEKDITAVAVSAQPSEPPKEPKKRKAKPAPKPRKELERDELYEAVELHIFGTTPDENAPYDFTGRCGLIAGWLAGRIGKHRDKEFGKISAPAKSEHVKLFVEWYGRKYQDASLPKDPAKFVEHWREWASSLRSNGNGAHAAAPNQPRHARAPRQMTAEEIAAEDAKWAAMNAPEGGAS